MFFSFDLWRGARRGRRATPRKASRLIDAAAVRKPLRGDGG